MSMEIPDLIVKLSLASYWLDQIFPPLQIVFGTFGNVFNIIIFTRRSLRTNPCSLYFLASSINNSIVICVGILEQYVENQLNSHPRLVNSVLCKLSTVAQYVPFALILWFPVLASIDRFLSSSRSIRLRQLSTLSVARKAIVCVTIFGFAIHLHMPVFYQSIQYGGMFFCAVTVYEYYLFFNIFGPLVACILPIIFLSIFGILMVRNVRSVHNRVALQNGNRRNEHTRSNDQQLCRMLLSQVLLTILISVPYVVASAYDVLYLTVLGNTFTPVGAAAFFFSKKLFSALYLINPVIGFYIYTLTGPKFRVEVKRCAQLGLSSILTVTGRLQRLPTNAVTANVITVRSEQENNVPLTQQNQPVKMAWIA